MKYIDSFLTADGIAIVMQFCEDGNLESVIERGPIPFYYTCKIILDVVRGLDQFHMQGMVHRDIKPDNIFFHQKCAVIGDLGLSRVLDNGCYVSKVGYIYYAAPEINKSSFFSTQSDIWSLGCVILTMLSGKLMESRKPPIFVLRQYQINNIIKHICSDSAPELITILEGCLAKDIECRPNTQEIKLILENIISQFGNVTINSHISHCTKGILV